MSLISLIHSGFNHQNGDLTGFNVILYGIYNYPWLYGCVWKWVVYPQIAEFSGKSGPCAGIVCKVSSITRFQHDRNDRNIDSLVVLFCMNPQSSTGWWFGTMEFYDFPFSWEFHHPNWRTPSFFRGVGQPPNSPCFSVEVASFAGMRFIDTSRRTNQRASWTKCRPQKRTQFADELRSISTNRVVCPQCPDTRQHEPGQARRNEEVGWAFHDSQDPTEASSSTAQMFTDEQCEAIKPALENVSLLHPQCWNENDFVKSRSHIYPICWYHVISPKYPNPFHLQLLAPTGI